MGEEGIPGLGVKCFRDLGFTEKDSRIPGFHLYQGQGFQGGNLNPANTLFPGSFIKSRQGDIILGHVTSFSYVLTMDHFFHMSFVEWTFNPSTQSSP